VAGNFFGGQFFGGGFFGAIVDSTDTHDGDGKKKPWHQRIEKAEVDAKVKSYRSSRQKLAEDIRFAMDGPAEAPVLEAIRENLDPVEYEKMGSPDFEPELRGLLSQTEGLRKIARAVIEEHQRLEMEDEEETIVALLTYLH
jgi:hypothetical protein